MTTLSMKPLVFRVEPFLTEAEMSHVTKMAAPYMRDSPVALMDHDQVIHIVIYNIYTPLIWVYWTGKRRLELAHLYAALGQWR